MVAPDSSIPEAQFSLLLIYTTHNYLIQGIFKACVFAVGVEIQEGRLSAAGNGWKHPEVFIDSIFE